MTFAHNATADWDTTVTDTSYKTHKKQKNKQQKHDDGIVWWHNNDVERTNITTKREINENTILLLFQMKNILVLHHNAKMYP